MKNKPSTIPTLILSFFVLLLCFLSIPAHVMAEVSLEDDIKPETKIEIPGLKFSHIEEIEKAGPDGRINTFKLVPYLGEHISAIYRYTTIFAGILAVVMVIIGGLGWAISGGNAEKIKSAQKKIGGAIVGFLIVISSYVILHTINPSLVIFKPLEIMYIEGIDLASVINSDTPGDAADIEELIKTKSNKKISSLLLNINQLLIRYLAPNSAVAIIKKPSDPCWGYSKPTQNLTGNSARQGAKDMGEYLKKSKIVSYAYGGSGILTKTCTDPKPYKSKDELQKIICDTKYPGGGFHCEDGSLGKEINSGKNVILPWQLDYCLDCSNFIKQVYTCGANKAVAGGTATLFGCEPENLLKYQPIPQNSAKQGDIVGYQQNKNIGIDVGHAMLCINNGCTQVLHVHGPQATKTQYLKQALDYGDENYLKRLLQDKLETIRSRNTKYAWPIQKDSFNYLGNTEDKEKIINDIKKTKKQKIKWLEKTALSPYFNGYGQQILLPDETIREMEKQTNWKFEYRKVRTIEHVYSNENELYKLLAQSAASCNEIESNTVCSKSNISKMKAKGYCK